MKSCTGKTGLTAFLLVLTLIGVILLSLILSILRLNKGVFIYSMDDLYIELALSDQIRHGNYGMYPGTPAAPGSSILYPLLLAVGLWHTAASLPAADPRLSGALCHADN